MQKSTEFQPDTQAFLDSLPNPFKKPSLLSRGFSALRSLLPSAKRMSLYGVLAVVAAAAVFFIAPVAAIAAAAFAFVGLPALTPVALAATTAVATLLIGFGADLGGRVALSTLSTLKKRMFGGKTASAVDSAAVDSAAVDSAVDSAAARAPVARRVPAAPREEHDDESHFRPRPGSSSSSDSE